jgi:RHS repeat-associated protein
VSFCSACPLAAPVVSYAYDSGDNAKGKLSSLTDQAGAAIYAYDILGRLTSEIRTIAGISKTTAYSYHLGGSLKTLTYPSNRVVTFTPDSTGSPVSAVDGNGTNYVVSANYNPDGSLKSLVNGSTPALSQNFQYTPRLQLCRITTLTSGTLPTSCTDSQNIGNIMDRGYDFHAGNGTAGSGSDNGNVFAITNYRDTNRSQAFTYDALNRLASGWSSANTGTYSWGENYSIDAWGNLQISPMGTKAHGGTFQLSGNAQNQPTGMNYDAAGNLLSYLSATYVYDQENRLASTAGTTYTYDGNGERVLKSQVISNVLTPVKSYWSMGRNTLAEGDGSGNLTAEYIYFGGKRVARIDLPANTVHYYLSDHLGSTSIVASSTGTIEEESDYYPFGTEVIVAGPGTNELKFTGKRRDTESQLDYFGARYYSNVLGRFSSPDWSAKPVSIPYADLKNPQTLTQYAYVRNSPNSFVDKDGHVITVKGDEQKRYVKDLEKATGLTIAADKNGKLSITKAPDKLSAVAKQIQKIIQDPKHNVNINALSESSSGVVVGQFYGHGSQTLDFKSIGQISGKGGATETSAIIHETTEAYAGTLNGGNYQASHAEGISYENLQRMDEGVGARIGESSTPTASGAHVEINFSFSRESFDVDRNTSAVSNVSVQPTNNEPSQLPPQ